MKRITSISFSPKSPLDLWSLARQELEGTHPLGRRTLCSSKNLTRKSEDEIKKLIAE